MYEDLGEELYQDLLVEFGEGLPLWCAQLSDDLRLRFTNTELFFEAGDSQRRAELVNILGNFSRYVEIVAFAKYPEEVLKVRIQGHTSSFWVQAKDSDEADMRNMARSQERTRAALGIILDLEEVKYERDWLREKLTVNGLSSSQRIFDDAGEEDAQR